MKNGADSNILGWKTLESAKNPEKTWESGDFRFFNDVHNDGKQRGNSPCIAGATGELIDPTNDNAVLALEVSSTNGHVTLRPPPAIVGRVESAYLRRAKVWLPVRLIRESLGATERATKCHARGMT